MFRYYNGGFKTVSQIAYETFVEADEAKEAVDNLEIGGRNYVLGSNSDNSTADALIARYPLSEPMISGEEYTLSLSITPDSSLSAITLRDSGGSQILATISLSSTGRQTEKITFSATYASGKTPQDQADYAPCGRIWRHRSKQRCPCSFLSWCCFQNRRHDDRKS